MHGPLGRTAKKKPRLLPITLPKPVTRLLETTLVGSATLAHPSEDRGGRGKFVLVLVLKVAIPYLIAFSLLIYACFLC